MATKKKKPSLSIRTTQDEYFAIARKIWASVLLFIGEFGKRKGFYTAELVNTALQAIADAENLPTRPVLSATGKLLRDQLEKLATAGIYQWGLLASYIKSAYPDATTRDIHLVAAGKAKAPKAKNLNWESVKGLLEAGNRFIVAHHDELSANNNMPRDFQAAFEKANTDFLTKLAEFNQEKEVKSNKGTDRQAAILATYRQLMDVCEDGAFFFKDEPKKRDLFVYDEVLRVLLGGKAGGTRTTEAPSVPSTTSGRVVATTPPLSRTIGEMRAEIAATGRAELGAH